MKFQLEQLVCRHLGVPTAALRRRDRHSDAAWARFVCYFMLQQIFGMTAWQIGHYFKRDHSGVFHGLEVVQTKMAAYPAVGMELNQLRAKILATITQPPT